MVNEIENENLLGTLFYSFHSNSIFFFYIRPWKIVCSAKLEISYSTLHKVSCSLVIKI